MNMREFWANEAAAMRDTSGVLGKEVLKPVSTNSAPKKNEEKFKTGYSCKPISSDNQGCQVHEIRFATYVVNTSINLKKQAKSKRIEEKTEVEYVMKGVKALFESLFSCEVDDNIYKAIFDYEIIETSNNKYYEYTLGNEPDYYLMNLNDSKHVTFIPSSIARLDRAYIFVSIDMDSKDKSKINYASTSRTGVHESLHPIQNHPWTTDSIGNNNLSPLNSMFKKVLADLIKVMGKPELNTFLKSQESQIIIKNIMNSDENPNFYLWGGDYSSSQMEKEQVIEGTKFVESIKLKK
jgi:hypothetical protein